MCVSHDTCWVRVTPVVLDLEQPEDLFQFQWLGTWVLARNQGCGEQVRTSSGTTPRLPNIQGLD